MVRRALGLTMSLLRTSAFSLRGTTEQHPFPKIGKHQAAVLFPGILEGDYPAVFSKCETQFLGADFMRVSSRFHVIFCRFFSQKIAWNLHLNRNCMIRRPSTIHDRSYIARILCHIHVLFITRILQLVWNTYFYKFRAYWLFNHPSWKYLQITGDYRGNNNIEYVGIIWWYGWKISCTSR